MLVAEADLDLLETYLDGELPVADAEGLWHRLAAEPELTAALDQLRAQRAVRMAIWTQDEPTDPVVAKVNRKVVTSIRRMDWLETITRSLKFATAAAACIVFGFGVGWLGRANFLPTPHLGSPDIHTVQLPGASGVNDNGHHTYPVAIRDEAGRVIAVQQFDSLQDANDFANDLTKWQAGRQQQPSRDVPVVPVSDEQQF